MPDVKIGAVTIGRGAPKICASLMGSDLVTLLKEAEAMADSVVDIVEWRLDYVPSEVSLGELLAWAKALKVGIEAKPLLLTFRTAQEGGERSLSLKAYQQLYETLLMSGVFDAIDLEYDLGDAVLKPLISLAQKQQVTVIISHHDFQQTPSKDELIDRLSQMSHLGGSVNKIAVMPQSSEDVLTLLAATNAWQAMNKAQPLITISMGELGKVSRLAGGLFGSALTFGALEATSAPGQLDVNFLKVALNHLTGDSSESKVSVSNEKKAWQDKCD